MQTKPPIKRKTNRPCHFCKEKKTPDFRDIATLGNFLSDRAKIVGPDRSGTCARHQRMVAINIKRARHLGLLPFASAI